MTASSSVRPSTGVADPSDPANVTVPFLTDCITVTASATQTYSPPLLALVPASNGNINVILQKSTVALVLKATAGTPITGLKILQVRSTNTTVSGIKGLR